MVEGLLASEPIRARSTRSYASCRVLLRSIVSVLSQESSIAVARQRLSIILRLCTDTVNLVAAHRLRALETGRDLEIFVTGAQARRYFPHLRTTARRHYFIEDPCPPTHVRLRL